jgi:hypothetical protein
MGTQFVSPRSICGTVEGAIATEIVSQMDRGGIECPKITCENSRGFFFLNSCSYGTLRNSITKSRESFLIAEFDITRTAKLITFERKNCVLPNLTHYFITISRTFVQNFKIFGQGTKKKLKVL